MQKLFAIFRVDPDTPECRHASQMIQVRAGGNFWRSIDDYYGGVIADWRPFVESDAYCVNMEANGDWLYTSTRFSYFRDFYNNALARTLAIASPTTQASAKALLQSVYERIPFIEMKKTGYDFSVRAPQ